VLTLLSTQAPSAMPSATAMRGAPPADPATHPGGGAAGLASAGPHPAGLGPGAPRGAPWGTVCLAVLVQRSSDKAASVRAKVRPANMYRAARMRPATVRCGGLHAGVRSDLRVQALACLAGVAGAWAERTADDPDLALFRQARLGRGRRCRPRLGGRAGCCRRCCSAAAQDASRPCCAVPSGSASSARSSGAAAVVQPSTHGWMEAPAAVSVRGCDAVAAHGGTGGATHAARAHAGHALSSPGSRAGRPQHAAGARRQALAQAHHVRMADAATGTPAIMCPPTLSPAPPGDPGATPLADAPGAAPARGASEACSPAPASGGSGAGGAPFVARKRAGGLHRAALEKAGAAAAGGPPPDLVRGGGRVGSGPRCALPMRVRLGSPVASSALVAVFAQACVGPHLCSSQQWMPCARLPHSRCTSLA